jgi:hypothetical protein
MKMNCWRAIPMIMLLVLGACASTPKTVIKFRDGSVLTAKSRNGNRFEQAHYVTEHGRESVTASYALVQKPSIVFIHAVVSTSHGPAFAAEEYQVNPQW